MAGIAWIDDQMAAVYEAGRIGIREYLTARYARFDADIELRQAWAQHRPRATAVVWPRVQADYGTADEPHGLLDSKATAKAKFETVRADPKALRESQVAAARTATRQQMTEYIAGRGSYYFLLRWAERLRTAGLALATTKVDRFAYLEGYWLTTWQDEMTQKDRFEGGYVTRPYYLHPRYKRLEAEIALARAWSMRAKHDTRTPLPEVYGYYPLPNVTGRYIELGNILNAKAAAGQVQRLANQAGTAGADETSGCASGVRRSRVRVPRRLGLARRGAAVDGFGDRPDHRGGKSNGHPRKILGPSKANGDHLQGTLRTGTDSDPNLRGKRALTRRGNHVAAGAG